MNNIDDLRTHLFETLAALRDKTDPMELDRAKAVAQVAQVIVDTARVEVQMAKVTGEPSGSTFLTSPEQKLGTPEHPRLVKRLR